MKTKLISKILGVGLALGLVFSLGAAFVAAPAAQADQMEWGPVNTPSWDDLVILPASDILDYAVGGDEGNVIYAVLELDSPCVEVGWSYKDSGTIWPGNFALVKSKDGGVTWGDITDKLMDASSLPTEVINSAKANNTHLSLVAVAPDDDDWVAVAGYYDGLPNAGGVPFVVASQDGGSNFTYAHPVKDTSAVTEMVTMMDMALSPKVGSIHNIALAGIATDIPNAGAGAVFRLEAGTWLTGGWVDTRFYPGWNDSTDTPNSWDFETDGVVAVDFSPNFDMDDTIVCMSVGNYLPYIQEGTLDGDGAWNAEAGFGDAVQIKDDGTVIQTLAIPRFMGFALPADFDGAEPRDNNIYFYVNATDNYGVKAPIGYVMISEDGALTGRCGPSGDPLLASIDVHGDADTCKAMVGTLGVTLDKNFNASEIKDCAGVAVYHTVELDDCCPRWESACKDPSGPIMAVVVYTEDGKKAYATTSGSQTFLLANEESDSHVISGWALGLGNLLDESAFSVSLDDAVSFNQIGLIDTDIDFLSDVAVCPDCSVIYLSTIQNGHFGECLNEPLGAQEEHFACDSVWRSYDNGDTWERVYHGDWTNARSGWEAEGQLLLRLPCDEDTECCTIYMGIQGTKDLFYSRDCGQCWNKAVNQKLTIQDFAVESENVVYVLDQSGKVSKSTQYGRRPSDGVNTDIGSGHSITSCCHQGFVVVGGAEGGKVAWSDDGGVTWELTDKLPGDAKGNVHVACDPVCENIIYAAVDGKGIYRTDINDGSWDDMNAMEYDYTGIVVAREGTLYASSDEIWADKSVFCEGNRYGYEWSGDSFNRYSGVARNLTPCETDCCGTEDWDYLIAGLSPNEEDFDQNPSALRICGCLSASTNSVLWAIDTFWYDVVGASDHGLLWSYEDCAAKAGPALISPEDGAIVSCDVCASCVGSPMTLKWERMCLACSYDIEIMDENGNVIIERIDVEITGNPPSLYLDDARLECGRTYTWHVREANTETDECVHSPWSETWSFTVEASSANAVKLIAPEQGAVVAQRTGVGFSWTSVYDANKYTFVLSANPDLSGALATAEVNGTAYAYSGTLDYETTYYWQVTAWKSNTMLSQSDIGTFAIAAEEYIPPEPQPQEPPVINIPPTQQIVPTWIYAMIGIGAALIVVVIVLIVRSRRPS